MSVSSAFEEVDPDLSMSVMEVDQAMNLCAGRLRQRVLVLMSQPKVFLTSSSRPSARSFLTHIRSFRVMGSWVKIGRPIVWMASGTAADARSLLVGEWRETVIVSSMYTSTLPTGSSGIWTIIDLVWPKGMLSESSLGEPILC